MFCVASFSLFQHFQSFLEDLLEVVQQQQPAKAKGNQKQDANDGDEGDNNNGTTKRDSIGFAIADFKNNSSNEDADFTIKLTAGESRALWN